MCTTGTRRTRCSWKRPDDLKRSGACRSSWKGAHPRSKLVVVPDSTQLPRAVSDRLVADPTLCLDCMDPIEPHAHFVEAPLGVLGPPYVRPDRAAVRYTVGVNELVQRTVMTEPPARIAHYIFMTEYCCSTLLSQALGSLGNVFAYGERYPLASLAAIRRGLLGARRSLEEQALLMALTVRYQAKTEHADQVALLKEWSVSSIMARDVLRADSRSRGIFLYSDLDEFVVAVLKKEERRALVRHRMHHVFVDLRRLPGLAALECLPSSDAELAALHWLYQIYQFLADDHGEESRLRTLHSRVLKSDPGEALCAAVSHLVVPATEREVLAVIDGHSFRTHAKTGRPYSLEMDARATATAKARYQRELDAGLRFADGFLRAHPLPSRLGLSLMDEVGGCASNTHEDHEGRGSAMG